MSASRVSVINMPYSCFLMSLRGTPLRFATKQSRRSSGDCFVVAPLLLATTLPFLCCRAKTSLQAFQTLHHAKVATIMRQKYEQVQTDILDFLDQLIIQILEG